MDIVFLSWDFRSPLPAEEFAAAIDRFRGGPVYATAVDAGTDDYVLALSRVPISPDMAYASWVSVPEPA